MNKWTLALAISLGVAGCTPFPWWVYVAETRVDAASSDGFSDSELLAARAAAADVAREVGMQPRDELPEDLGLEQRRSATRSPPRRFLSVYKGRLSYGRPLILRVELSEDGTVLYFTLSDPNRGSPSPTFARINALLESRVEAAFPGLAIAHEPKSIGPIFSLPP